MLQADYANRMPVTGLLIKHTRTCSTVDRVGSGCHSRRRSTMRRHTYLACLGTWVCPNRFTEIMNRDGSNAATRNVRRSEFIRMYHAALSPCLSLSLIFSSSFSLHVSSPNFPSIERLIIGDAGSRQFEPVCRRRCPASTSAPLASPLPPPTSKLLPKSNYHFHHPSLE